MNSRRNFIKQSGILTAGIMIGSCNSSKPKKYDIGLQLYTLREDIVKDPRAVLAAIAAAGYKNVETFGYGEGKFFGLSVKEFGQALKDNGLSTPSGHYAPGDFLFRDGNGDDVKELIEVAHTLGHEYIVIPYLSEDQRKTEEQYKHLTERMNLAGELCRDSSLQLGYHNHSFEFTDLGNGRHGYDILLAETDPALVKLEMDIYWVVRGGYDPIDMMKKHPGRFPLWHVKDMDKANRNENTEIGNGSIDYKSIFKEAKLSGLKYYYVEQENNYVPNPIESIGASSRYLKENI